MTEAKLQVGIKPVSYGSTVECSTTATNATISIEKLVLVIRNSFTKVGSETKRSFQKIDWNVSGHFRAETFPKKYRFRVDLNKL